MKPIHSTILITLFILVCSCGKTERYPLMGVDKAMIPYQIGDTIRYIDDKGGLATLVVVEIRDEWIPGDEDELTGKLRDEAERRTVFLRSEQGKILWVRVSGNEDMKRRALCATISNSRSTLSYGLIYNSKGNFVVDTQFSFYRFSVYDSLLINNRLYYDVGMHYSRQTSSEYPDDSLRFYYNKTHGVLRMMEKGKTLFTLDTVIFASAR